MKQNRKRIVVSFAIVILLIGLCVLGIISVIRISESVKEKRDATKHYVAVIVKSTTSAYWKSVYAGVKAASTEYNLTLTFEGPESEEDYETQNQLIEEAVKNGAEVIIFSAADFYGNADAINEAAKQGVKIIVIDSDVNSDDIACRISTDNYKAGYMAGEAAIAICKDPLKIGIINFDKNSANGQQREQGFKDAIAKVARAEVIDGINVISTTEDAKEGTKEMLKVHPDINVIATFNEWTSLGVGYAIQELNLGKETTVVAFDSNIISVGMLETGEVDALIVQNPYAMGYLAMESAYNLVNGVELESATVETDTTLVLRSNMFDEERQRVLFPFN